MLAKLKLAPDNVVAKCLGATSQFNSATAGLGLFARNRRVGKANERGKRETKSHKLVTLEKQNLRKRLVYSKKLNEIVKTMGSKLMADEPIPLNLWTQYDRLQRNPALKQRTTTDLELGTATMTPGPGAYVVETKRGEKNNKIPVSFGKSERWRGGGDKSDKQKEADKQDAMAHDSSYMRTGKLSQRRGMKWGDEERAKLNDLYWELGRPKRRSGTEEHYELYAKRHLVLFKNRPAKEVVERVRRMLKFNMFKERGEEEFWRGRKKEKEDVMTKPAKTQRKVRKGGAKRLAGGAKPTAEVKAQFSAPTL